jgi:aspartate aminotransferase
MSAPTAGTRVEQLPRSGIRVMAELARRTDGAIRLDIGDPDFATPAHVVDAIARAAADGHTHYGPASGLPSLRAALAESMSCSPEQVVVTVGAAGALFCSLLAIADAGDEVLLPDPGWANLVPMTLAAGARPVPYPLDRATGFEADLDALVALIGPRTRALVLNSPANPTGAVFSREAITAVATLAAERGIWLISDECYDALVLEGEHVAAAAVSPEPAGVVTVRSFSKTFAMTGWRVGYVVATPEIAALVARAQEAVLSCPATPVQLGAEAALCGPQDSVEEMRAAYARRRELALSTLDAGSAGYVRPRGAFYVMVDIAPSGQSSQDFALRLLTESKVAVVAGSAFGLRGEGLVRVSFAAPDEAVARGLTLLAEGLHTHWKAA